MEQIVDADTAAQELFKFTKEFIEQQRGGTTMLMLLGTAVHRPKYFEMEPLTKGSIGETVQLPLDSKQWGTDFLVKHIRNIRKSLGEKDVDVAVQNIDIFLNRALPEIAQEIEGSDAYKVAVGFVLNITINNLFGRDFLILPLDKLQLVLKKELGIAKRDSLRSELYNAAHFGKYKEVKKLIDKGANPNSENNQGVPALLAAACLGHTKVVKVLLASNAKVDLRNNEGATPLHSASLEGHRDVVKLLIASGADVNARFGDGSTALHVATQGCHVEVVNLLLSSGAEINAIDSMGLTPLHSVGKGCRRIVQLLLKKGADVNAKDRYGTTPLHLAVVEYGKYKDIKLVKLLLNWNANVNIKDNKGFTPLMLAESLGLRNLTILLQK